MPHAVCPVPHDIMHTPAWQLWPEPHTVPHVPQFARSLCRFAHPATQLVMPVGHATSLQWPAMHVKPGRHDARQLPQLLSSVWRSAQVDEQTVCMAGHVAEQLPATQTSPAAHAMPHAPQLLASTRVLMHTGFEVPPSTDVPAHMASEGPQSVLQWPAMHTCPAGQ